MVGRALRKLRRSVPGWPDTKMAETIGMGLNSLRRVERDNHSCSDEMVLAILAALGKEDQADYMLRLKAWTYAVIRPLPADAIALKPMLEALGHLYAQGRITPGMARTLHRTVAGDEFSYQSDFTIPIAMLPPGSAIQITIKPPKGETHG